jgi:hypothetical protein
MAVLESAAEAERENDASALLASAEADAASPDPRTSASGLFNLGRLDEAETIFRDLLVADPEDSYSLAYLGSITARKGRNASSVIDAVRFVEEAFVLLDRAVSLAGTGEGRETALMNRASVLASVPESVFAKNAAAAADYAALAEMASARDDTEACARRLLAASLSYEASGNDASAGICLARILSLSPVPATVALELAKRGYEPPR